MSSGVLRPKTLVLGVLAVLLAVIFAADQAQAVPNWMISPVGSEIGPKLPVELAVKAEKALNLLSTLSKKAISLTCETLAPNKALLEGEGKGSGALTFSGCLFVWGGVTQSKCKPHSKGAAEGTITTEALKSQLVSHEGATLEQVKPVSGETFVTIILGPEGVSNDCAAGEKLPVGGVFYAKDVNGKFEVEEEAHLLEEGPLTDLWILNKTAEHKTTLDGSASLSFTGQHLGREWSGLGS